MSMGPPDPDEPDVGADDVARPVRPSERDWRRRMREDEADDEDDGGILRVPLA